MKLYVGTSGYSYKEWKGPFYPEDLPDKEMLSYYGNRLPSVEINNTFYRMPKAEMLENWAAQVPEDFHFVLKASKKITHTKPLNEKADETEYLFKTVRALADKLGPILMQLPPYLRKNTELLRDFLTLIPDDIRCTFEFRHRSWFEEEVYELLRTKACALCCSDTDKEELSHLVQTADWGYFRLRKQDYSDDELSRWVERIKAMNWREAFVFFKHEDEGAGPKLAAKFRKLFDQA